MSRRMMLQAIEKTHSTYETIPDLVKYVAGDFSSQVLSIWGENAISEYMVATATQRHVWHAVLSAPASRLPQEIDMYKWVTRSRRKDLLGVAFGTCPPGMIRLLSKLGPCAELPEFYKAAHTALSRGDVLTRILQHAKTIDTRAVLLIAKVSSEKLAIKLANYALQRRIRTLDIEECLWLVKLMTNPMQRDEFLNDSSVSKNPLSSLRKAISRRSFPPAPWNIEGFLPINAGEELQVIARQLGNCLTDPAYFFDSCINAQAGMSYYYRTIGEDYLLLKFSKFGNLGWYLDECSGRKNRKPTKNEIDQIAQATAHLENIWRRRLSFEMW